MELSEEQQKAYNKYICGKNVFITGPGGTGKSELIRKIYSHAKKFEKNIHVTALTGCAAILLQCQARTLHSWAGIGLATQSVDILINKINKTKYKRQIWKDTDILVIDEVSMMSKKLFNTLDLIGRAIRKNPYVAFGGMQLIFSGDFYQLPPVGNNDDIETMQFCFESDSWEDAFPLDSHVELKRIFRQKDEAYSNILNQIREGKLKRSSNNILLQNVNKSLPENIIISPTKLFPTKNKVELINQSEMKKLVDNNCDEATYEVKALYDLPILTREERKRRSEFNKEDFEKEIEFLKSGLLCEQKIKLCVGTQVMCVVNKEVSCNVYLCNGSQGKIIAFDETTKYPIVRFIINKVVADIIVSPHVWQSEKIPGIGVSQIPLILAWALTIHKAQGATLDIAEIDAGSGIFEFGQTYVALSRVKSLDGLYLTSFDPQKIRINKKVREYYDKLQQFCEKEKDKDKEKVIEEKVIEDMDFEKYKYEGV